MSETLPCSMYKLYILHAQIVFSTCTNYIFYMHKLYILHAQIIFSTCTNCISYMHKLFFSTSTNDIFYMWKPEYSVENLYI